MKPIALIIRRELSAYLRSPLGWVVAAVVLLMDGLLFNSFALGSDTARKSSEILRQFFYFSSGTTMAASLFLSMRLIAEERQNGTLTLLFTSPIRDYQIVIGKFLSALIFLPFGERPAACRIMSYLTGSGETPSPSNLT